MNILQTEAQYTKYVLPVCVPQTGETFEGKTSVATGWGSTVSGGSSSPVHREVSLPVITTTECRTHFAQYDLADMVVPETQVCAGRTGGNKDTCQGDSGGPLVIKDTFWYSIGITSWVSVLLFYWKTKDISSCCLMQGVGCGDVGVYTRTSAFRDWILSFTGTLPTGN